MRGHFRSGTRGLLVVAVGAFLPGCYAGIAAVVAGVTSGSEASSSEGSFWQVTALGVQLEEPLETPAGCSAPAGTESVLAQIALLEGLSAFASGAEVQIDFQLQLKNSRGKPRKGAKTDVFLEVEKDGGKEVMRLGSFGEGDHHVSWDSTPHGTEGPVEVDLLVRPDKGGPDQVLAQAVLVDNRPVMPAALLGIASGGCPGGVQGAVDVSCGMEHPAADSHPAYEPDPALYVEDHGQVKRAAASTLLSDSRTPRNVPGEHLVSVSWDTAVDFPESSTDAFLILVLRDGLGGCRARAVLHPCGAERIHINNSTPEVSNVRVSSAPAGMGASVGHLVGRIIFEYEVKDDGGEPCDLELQVTLDDAENPIVVLSTSDGTLSEGLGSPSEGAGPIETSRDGLGHTFVWNSDHDIDTLVRAGRLSSPLVTGVTYEIVVKDRGSCLRSRPGDPDLMTFVLDNRLVHSVVGIVPGQTTPGRMTVRRRAATFETLAASETSSDRRTLFLVDSDAHLVWRMAFTDAAETVQRIIGNGSKRFNEDPWSFNNRVAVNVALDKPVDVAVASDGERDLVYLLERSAIVWRLNGGILNLVLDGREFMTRPESLAVEQVEGRTFIYIADPANCRILRHEVEEAVTTVILGDLRTLRPLDDPVLKDAAEQRDRPYPDTNGCNFTPDDSAPQKEHPRITLNEPLGIILHRSETGRRALIIADSKNGRILRLDLGLAGDLDPPAGPAVEILRRDFSTESLSVPLSMLCGPRGLRVADGFLYITCVGVAFNQNLSKGVVLRVPITEENGFLEVFAEGAEHVAGGLTVKGELVEPLCEGGSLNEAVTYDVDDECRPAREVPLSKPTDVVQDAMGRVHVCDSRNQRIRTLDESGECARATGDTPGEEPRLRTFVGDGVEGRSAHDVFLESSCSPFPASSSDWLPAPAFKLSRPLGMVFLDDDAILVCDRGNGRILRIDLRTGLVATLAGRPPTAEEKEEGVLYSGDGGSATRALFDEPRGLAIHPPIGFCNAPERKLYIADSFNDVVRVMDAQGNIDTIVGSGDPALDVELLPDVGAHPRSVFLKTPRQLALDSRGRLLIGDCRHRIVQLDTDGTLRRVIGVGAFDPQSPAACEDLATLRADHPNRVNPTDAASIGDGGPAIEAKLNQPSEMVFDPPEKFLYFADQASSRIRRVEYHPEDGSCGTIVTVAGTGARNRLLEFPLRDPPTQATSFRVTPFGLAIDPAGKFLYISEVFTPCRIYRLELAENPEEGTLELLAGREVPGAVGDGDEPLKAQLFNPNSVRLDSSGRILYVVDGQNQRVRRFWVGE